MAAIVNKLTVTERLNTGDFSYREYVVEVVNSDMATPETPENLFSMASRVLSLDPTRRKSVEKKESVARKVLSP